MARQRFVQTRLACSVAVIAGAVFSYRAHAGLVLFVDDDAPLGGDGLSWDTAYRFVQDALATAVAGTEIRVAQGIYKPDQDKAGNVTPGDREASFQLISGVALRGGYLGLSASKGEDPNDRDIALYETTLSGDVASNDGPHFANNDENSYHVVTGSGTNSTATLDGFTVTAGNAGGPAPHENGGGISNDGGSPTVANCRFERNWAINGAGLYTINESPALFDCTFRANRAVLKGGGIRSENCDPTITACVFQANLAQTGGGIYCLSGNLMLANCTFESNAATFAGGLFSAKGSPSIVNCAFLTNAAGVVAGGFYNVGDAVLTDCTFIGNTTENQAGGAMYSYGDVVITHCTFRDNIAGASDTTVGNGGAIASISGLPTIIDSKFVANEASNEGGAIYNGKNSNFGPPSSPTVWNCLFVGNTAGAGGAVANYFTTEPIYVNCLFSGNTAFNGGASFNRSFSSPTFLNSSFSGNSAQSRGGGISSHFDTVVTLTNCILWSNAAPDGPQISMSHANIPSVMTVFYSDVEGGEVAVDGGPAAILKWGPGNIDADPLFVDADGPDDVVGTEDDNLRLSSGSPCIDAGHNWAVPVDNADLDNDADMTELTPFDLDGNPRFVHAAISSHPGCGVPAVVDMGAYEFPDGNAVGIKLADIDGDGAVGMFDLVSLVISWGPTGGGCQLADLDLDGSVAVPDLLTLLANWGP